MIEYNDLEEMTVEFSYGDYKEDKLCIRLDNTDHKGLVFIFNEVSMNEKEDDDEEGAILKFDYDILSIPKGTKIEDYEAGGKFNADANSIVAKVLTEILIQRSKEVLEEE